MTQTSAAAGTASTSSLSLQRLLAAAIGAFIVGMVGFSHMTVAHNASHDYRHSMAFPCH
ncbi:MAG: CbtB domain-containing protein [Amaricoccus sp.]|uniref:CbtB domain-containing protein n=1 Tax=Amaricoccus sp. TaxID=1872485 RepID=UPI0039E707CD